MRCLTDPADFDERALDAIRKVYVGHTAPPLPSLDMSLGIAVAAGWEIHEVACGHDLMLAAPDETAALLDVISRGPG